MILTTITFDGHPANLLMAKYLGADFSTPSNLKTSFKHPVTKRLKEMYNVYVIKTTYLKYILMHKLSQDHLELFFGAIRSKGGFNNNPTAREFKASYKRVLVHNETSGPDTGNAINLEKISILSCGVNF